MYTYDFLNVKYFYLELNFTYIILHLFNRKTNKYFQNKIYVLRIIKLKLKNDLARFKL